MAALRSLLCALVIAMVPLGLAACQSMGSGSSDQDPPRSEHDGGGGGSGGY